MKYIIRLDDACEKRDIVKWNSMENILDAYGIKPLVGIIPCCEDRRMQCYAPDPNFWDRSADWLSKGWTLALHGYNHVYASNCRGINPINNFSEFAGEPLEIQKEKIADGVSVFRQHGIEPKVFFAPAHTFDRNTLTALELCSNIRIISDTVANDVYTEYGFTFVPQQSGAVRNLPFKTVTFCYHPNMMRDCDFGKLEQYLKVNPNHIPFPLEESSRKKSLFDVLLNKAYFMRRK